MKVNNISSVAVIGAGNMGHQIGTLCAMHGYDTYVTDSSSAQLERAKGFVEKYLPERVQKGRITQEESDAAAALIHFEPDMKTAVENADIVIEAVFEDFDLKVRIFKECEQYCKEDAIFVTNASYIPSSRIAQELKNPERICNMHFFNPALVMKCVEVMRGPHTADDVYNTVIEFGRSLGKVIGELKKELRGMVSSRITTIIAMEAFWMYESGYASYEDIDLICKTALGHPMGPFELADLTGLDLNYIASMARFRETNDRNDLPWPCVVEKYLKGEWGRKTGKGFYEYPANK